MSLQDLLDRVQELAGGDSGRGDLPVMILTPNGGLWALDELTVHALADGEVIAIVPEG